MKIFWSDFASEMLKEIYEYLKENASKKIAKRIKNEILDTTKQLEKFGKSGQIEPTLEKLNEGHRYLVKGNYKIIYKEIYEGILITDVFHTKQNPTKLQRNKE